MSRSNLVDVEVEIHLETERAWLVSDDGDRDSAVWIPKSQAELVTERRTHMLTLPEWLATEKGLI